MGKTYSIIEFAKVAFENHVAVNFEERPEFSMCFQSFDVKEIMEKISVLSGSEITAGKTGTLKSMRLFLKEHPSSPLGIRFSIQALSFCDRILSIPLYMVNHWEHIVKSIG